MNYEVSMRSSLYNETENQTSKNSDEYDLDDIMADTLTVIAEHEKQETTEGEGQTGSKFKQIVQGNY